MLELVLANLKTRPFRSLISIIGVALGVVLVVLVYRTGARNERRYGETRGKLEGGNSFSPVRARWNCKVRTPMSTRLTPQRLLEIEGVESTVPVIRYITPNTKARWGVEQIDGVEWQPFAEMNDMQIVEGRAAVANDEIILDERKMSDDKYKIGDTMELFSRPYKIVGVFSPPSGARIKMSLAAMQDALESPNKCTYILVKLKDGADVNAVAARINEELPGNKINLTSDLIIDAQDRIPALNTFLRVLVGLGAFVSTIFVLLSMYTTITERRKEIGILKSLGASKSFIIKVIEGEAFMIGIFGVLLGFVVSFLASFLIQKQFDLQFEFSRRLDYHGDHHRRRRKSVRRALSGVAGFRH